MRSTLGQENGAEIESSPEVTIGTTEAVFFDVFGTLVDWRSSLIKDLTTFGMSRQLSCDWPKFVDEWRAASPQAMMQVRKNLRGWTNLDVLLHESASNLLIAHGLEVTTEDREWLVGRWAGLTPWPDVKDGLIAINMRFRTATLSNANHSLLSALCNSAQLRFTKIFCAETFQHYKPDPEIYLGAAGEMNLHPTSIALVASHSYDLEAAQSLGFKTVLLSRPEEHGGSQSPRPPNTGSLITS